MVSGSYNNIMLQKNLIVPGDRLILEFDSMFVVVYAISAVDRKHENVILSVISTMLSYCILEIASRSVHSKCDASQKIRCTWNDDVARGDIFCW